MSNVETRPAEMVCGPNEIVRGPNEIAGGGAEGSNAAEVVPGSRVLSPRDVPLGGLRAMLVRRTLPQRERSFVGAWCFADHYGPDNVADTGGMVVPPHPHTGLQTVSWLFTGEVEHRDSIGTRSLVRPGELNLMTAGHGISHSEVSTASTTVLHGIQLWVALPAHARDVEPAFESYIPELVERGAARIRVFLGALAGQASPVKTYTPLLGAEIELPAGQCVDVELDPAFEHGLLVDAGEVSAAGSTARRADLLYVPPGEAELRIEAAPGADVRLVILGGPPFGEKIVMWWNFVGRSHEDIVTYREQYQQEIASAPDARPRFGSVQHYPGAPLPAPPLPGSRLKPRS